MSYKLFVTDFINDDLKPEHELLGDIASVAALNAFDESVWPRIDSADAIMLYHNLKLSRKTIERLDRCKLIVRCGVGYDNVDHVFARSRRNIPVANVPDYGTEDVADSAIGLMLSLTRGIHFLNSKLRERQGPWSYTQIAPLQRIRGRVFGIIGLGAIGTASALRAKALGMDVVFYDPLKQSGYDKALGIRRADSLEELLKQTFVLSPHCFLSEQTRHIVNAETIKLMPRGSYLVNTARGAVVDTKAIPDAIASGHLAGAGIDVLESEPARDDDPLVAAWRDPNHPAFHRVIINPHSAFYSEQGLMDMRVKGSNACRNALTGRPIPNIVN